MDAAAKRLCAAGAGFGHSRGGGAAGDGASTTSTEEWDGSDGDSQMLTEADGVDMRDVVQQLGGDRHDQQVRSPSSLELCGGLYEGLCARLRYFPSAASNCVEGCMGVCMRG